MSMKNYLIKFELLRNTCASYEVEVPDKIIAHQMLMSANLPLNKKELIITTLTKFDSDSMRNQILKIFCEESVPDVSSSSSKIEIKSEVPDEESSNFAMFGSSRQKYFGRRKKKMG